MTQNNPDRQTLLVQSIQEIRRLKAELQARESEDHEPIAIVGMACRMPGGADDLDGFWDLLTEGRDGTSTVPADRWDADHYHEDAPGTPGRIRTRRGGFLSGVDTFDAPFFGISPREAAALDPQQRLLLEVGWEAIEHAGQSPASLAGSATGVYFGVTTYDYSFLQMRDSALEDLDTYTLTSNASTFAAGRLSYWLGLSGPSLSVDTACSSSLVGVHLACQSLRLRETSMALAGGVNVLLAPEWSVIASKAQMLSADGRCKTFDASADGYGRGEGCGVVVLKRLADALESGDRVLAVIRGSAVNQDGRSSGITVPNAAAQKKVVLDALRNASVSPDEVDYVEAHGTGTPLGDPIELRALDGVLGHDRQRPLRVGSVKTNIGHLEAAAGVAGLIKTVLSLGHGQIPAHLHLKEPNPEIGLDGLAVRIPTSQEPWPDKGTERVAGVSSFGASGTNAHVVLAQAPEVGPRETGLERSVHLLPLSAKTPEALTELAHRYREHLDRDPDTDLADICFTAGNGRTHFPHRLAVTGADHAEIARHLTRHTEQDAPSVGYRRGHRRSRTRPKTAFLFTGQGSQYPGMAALLRTGSPLVARILYRADDVLTPLLGRSLNDVLDPAPEDADWIHQTRFTQPVLLALEFALSELWRSWGIEPDAVLGHSVGELAAACAAGAIGLEDALRLAAERGRLMQDLTPEGSMATVFADQDTVRPVLSAIGGVEVAAVNGLANTVVSGPPDRVSEVLDALTEQGVRHRSLATSRAFHSALMDPMLDGLEEAAASVDFHAPRVPLASNLDGTLLSGDGALSARYVRDLARQPVEFAKGVRTLVDQGFEVFVEVGPSPSLCGIVQRNLSADQRREAFLIPSLRNGKDDWSVLMDGLATAYTAGLDVDWAGLDLEHDRRRVTLPAYPFQRNRHWFRPTGRAATDDGTPMPSANPPSVPEPSTLLGERIASPMSTAQFSSLLDPERHPCLADCVMDGLAVVNIGVYLEAALEGHRALHGSGPAAVTDCVVPRGLVLDPDESRRAHLTVDARDDGSSDFRYFAAADGSSTADWLLYCRGRTSSLTATDVPPRLDIEALLGDLPSEMSGEEFHRRMWRRRLYLGPSAQWVEQVQHGSGQALARLRPPTEQERHSYLLPPGLTDALFQVLFSCLPTDVSERQAYMLVGLDRFAFHGISGLGGFHCHARILSSGRDGGTLTARVTLYDEDTNPVVEVDGAYLRTAGADSVLREGVSDERMTAVPDTVTPASPPLASWATQDANSPEAVRSVLVAAVARAMGADESAVSTDEPLQNLGLDSLMALEVRDAVSSVFAVDLPLVSFLEGHAVDDLAEEVLALSDASGPARAAESSAEPALLPSVVALPEQAHDPFPLTDLQQAYLVGRSGTFELGDSSTYFFIEVDVEGVDLERLNTALREMIRRHAMLRAVVTPDGYQRILPEVPGYDIAVTDLRTLDEEATDARLAQIHRAVRDRVFDTEVWPLFEVRATRVDDERTRLHIGLDALIIDAWSTSLLFGEWAQAYREGIDGLPQTSLTYRDYVVSARSIEGTHHYTRSRDYWLSRLDELPPAPGLPLAKDPSTLVDPAFSHRAARLSGGEWTRFKELAAAHGVTPSAALCAAYARVLAAWSKEDSFTLNLLFFNRLPLHPDVSQIVGNFSSTTLLEVRDAAGETFPALSERLQRQLWNDLEHSHFSGVQVLRELNRGGGGTTRASMPVVFASTVNFGSKEDEPASVGLAQHLIDIGDSGTEVSSSIRTPQVWLDHQVVEDHGELVLNWDVIEELFPDGLVDAMFSAYVDLVRGLCSDESAWEGRIPVLPSESDLAERQAVNATTAPLPLGLLHEPFLGRAAQSPERVAVIAPERTLSYGDLDAESERVARWLRARGVGVGSLVGVVMDKGWEQVVAVLGVLRAGAAYVPIDAAVPSERLRVLIESAGATTVLTQSWVEEHTSWPEGTVRLSVDGPIPDEARVAGPVVCDAGPDDLAYVIFTSGSTGTPKGVMIEHSAALNTVADVNTRFGVTEDDRVLALSALNFDLSVYDVFGLLAVGGAIVIPRPEDHREPARWWESVVEHGVTVWNTVPALMEMFTEHALATGIEAGLRVVMMSGDWIPVTLPDRIRRFAPDARLWSLGGATEAAIWSILHPIGEVEISAASIPYGVPMLNQRFHVLDKEMVPCPTWVPGDLYIAGAGLARGYLGDEARTRRSFVRHPGTGERLYRTGDLGRYLPGGTIEFLGREDFQVKVQGYRIELGEIEATLSRIPGVRACVVDTVGHAKGGLQLVAFAVPEADHVLDPDELRALLREQMPEYMVPQHMAVLDELPLTANGKVDRGRLPALGGSAAEAAEPTPPRDEDELLLARTWSEFFDLDAVSVHDSFFDLGGNSLLAVRLMSRIRQESGHSLALATLFERPTIALLAEELRRMPGQASRHALVPMQEGDGRERPLFLIHPVGGDVLCYSGLLTLLGEELPVYGLQFPDGREDITSLEDLAEHYAEVVKDMGEEGPYRIGGWSMGGVLALEVARLLKEAGHEVELVCAIDLMEPPEVDTRSVTEADLLAWLAGDLTGLSGAEPNAKVSTGTATVESVWEDLRGAGTIHEDIDLSSFTEIFDRFSRNARLLMRHGSRPFDGTVLLFQGLDGGASNETVSAWAELLTGDHKVIGVPGDHYSIMRPPHLQAIGEELKGALFRAGQGSNRSSRRNSN